MGQLGRLWTVIIVASVVAFLFVIGAAFLDAELFGGKYHTDLGIYTIIGSVFGGAFSVQVLAEILRRRR